MEDDVVVLTTNKKKAVWLLIGCSIFVAGDVLLIRTGNNQGIAWAGIAFFGMGILVAICMMVPGAMGLKIGKRGIEIKSLFKTSIIDWRDVDGFYVGKIQAGLRGVKMIGIEYSAAYKKQRVLHGIATSMTGMEGALPNHFNLPAEKVCAVLNEAKAKWG